MKCCNFSVVSFKVGEVKVIWKRLLFAWKSVEERKKIKIKISIALGNLYGYGWNIKGKVSNQTF